MVHGVTQSLKQLSTRVRTCTHTHTHTPAPTVLVLCVGGGGYAFNRIRNALGWSSGQL